MLPVENKCRHQLCECEAPAGSNYCSELCEQQEKAEPEDAMTCSCGHPDCGAGGSGEKKTPY
jgi:hypothetical protein